MRKLFNPQNMRFFLLETVWLEPENFLLAEQISSLTIEDNAKSWQTYLDVLGLAALETWLSERLTDKKIVKDIGDNTTAGHLEVGDFKFRAIATENMIDDTVSTPREIVENLQLAANFYVLVEVCEESEEANIRGFLSHKQLVDINNSSQLSIHDDCYEIPVSLFDTELNHILTYSHYARASDFAICALKNPLTQASENLSAFIESGTTKLTQWLQGTVDESWKMVDYFFHADSSLAFNTRNHEKGIRRGKIIDLGIDLGSQKFVLLLNISSEKNPEKYDENGSGTNNQEKIIVLAQLYPKDGEKFLPHGLDLSLISKNGKLLQNVISRVQDNYIQLKAFKGEPGKKFSIQVSLNGTSVSEQFEL